MITLALSFFALSSQAQEAFDIASNIEVNEDTLFHINVKTLQCPGTVAHLTKVIKDENTKTLNFDTSVTAIDNLTSCTKDQLVFAEVYDMKIALKAGWVIQKNVATLKNPLFFSIEKVAQVVVENEKIVDLKPTPIVDLIPVPTQPITMITLPTTEKPLTFDDIFVNNKQDGSSRVYTFKESVTLEVLVHTYQCADTQAYLSNVLELATSLDFTPANVETTHIEYCSSRSKYTRENFKQVYSIEKTFQAGDTIIPPTPTATPFYISVQVQNSGQKDNSTDVFYLWPK